MTLRDREEWAEENGSYGRCPNCRKRIWVESGCLAECSCGWDARPEPTEPPTEGMHECRDCGQYCPVEQAYCDRCTERDRRPQTLADVGMCEADFR